MNNYTRTMLLLLLFTGCSSDPIVDGKGMDMSNYQQDLEECEALASHVDDGRVVGSRVVLNALAGALSVALVGHDEFLGEALALGAVGGAVDGVAEVADEKALVARNCLDHRGYPVMNR